MKNILIPVTNHPTLGTTNEANGTYAPELTHALAEFIDAGFSYDLVSIKGGQAPIYGAEDADDEAHKRVMLDPSFITKLEKTLTPSDVNVGEYDAVFYPGGFGLLSDLSDDKSVAQLTAKIYEAGGVVGAVCHGPAALLPIVLSNGQPLLANKKVTAFTHEEEIAADTIDKIPFILEYVISKVAASYTKINAWKEFIVIDGKLITGQNPSSAHGVGKAMVDSLR